MAINYIEKGIGLHIEVEKQGYSLTKLNDKWVSSNDVEVQNIINSYDPLPHAKSEAKKRILAQSEAHMYDIESRYPSFERQTWQTQKTEVEAWKLDNSLATPTIDIIASNRGVDRIVLLNRIYDKAVSYNSMAASLAGKRQKLEDAIDASTDFNFIESINFVG